MQYPVGYVEVCLDTLPDKNKKVYYKPKIPSGLQKFINIMKIITGKYCGTYNGSDRSDD
jgi:uncharacterized membrane protein